MKALLQRILKVGKPKEVHVRVACPPIISPCFYGIDMSTVGELFAPKFLGDGRLNPQAEACMAAHLGATSLRYLPVEAVARAIGLDENQLCRACITGHYPTRHGSKLAAQALENFRCGIDGRTYEASKPSGGEMVEEELPPLDDGDNLSNRGGALFGWQLTVGSCQLSVVSCQ